MAAKGKKTHKGKGKGRRSNPSHHKKKKSGRRRNPPQTFMGALGHILGAAAVGLVAGGAVLYGQQKIAPGSAASLYGVPAVGVLVGAAVAKKAPTIGVGLALGSILGPFTIPVASKVLGAASSSTTTSTAAQTAALAAVQLGAVTMGQARRLLKPDTLYDVSAVEMGHAYAYN